MARHLLARIGPPRRRWSWLAFVADSSENRIKGLAHSSRSEEPEVTDGVLVALRNVLGPTVDELFKGTMDLNDLA